ncbi:hypothetical protein J1792_16665 [Streptomyces triculaminicus]|uniref:Uncharacterized protein n=2 Tax=Streptomyces TaxID=1883 RepID=A0A939FPM2_9ACTN|nr:MULTISPECIES: hypothetical protein [Streptomyces]MBO0654348.1 hypothetical protein [Streptomyces triculaminicus]QSY48981.1 hypothetical protein J3S04_28940 [Streptomyces griseocarneus]
MGVSGIPGASGNTAEATLEAAASAPRRTLNSLLWAVLIPVVSTAAGFLAQYPYGLWAGVVIALGATAAAAIVAGGMWNRAGAATLASFATLALALFGGPTLYETYVKTFGERVDALVADTGQRVNAKGTKLDVCRVVDTTGRAQDVSEQQNCHGQFKPEQHVILFNDPLGGLDPWVEATGDRTLDPVGPACTGGLFALTGGALFYAGQRRRTDRDMALRQRRGYGAPHRSEP